MTVHGRNSWIKGASYNFTASGGELPGQTSLISLRTRASINPNLLIHANRRADEEHTQRRKVWDAAFHTTTIKGAPSQYREESKLIANRLPTHHPPQRHSILRAD